MGPCAWAGQGNGGALGQLQRNDEGEQTLNQLLACMDGIDTKVRTRIGT